MMAVNLQTIHQSHEAWSSHDTGWSGPKGNKTISIYIYMICLYLFGSVRERHGKTIEN